MIAHEIWLALCNPPLKNPIFEFSLKSNRDQLSLPIIRLITFAMGALIFATLLFFLVLSLTTSSFARILGVVPVMFGFVLILSTIVDGGMWTMRVADGIAFHHRNRQWDLLAVTPAGEKGVVWAICRGTFQRWGLLHRGLRSMRRSLVFFSLVIAFFMFQALISRPFQEELVYASFQLGLMLGLFYFDYLHCVSCAALAGMLAGQVSVKRAEAQILSYTIYQVVQFTIYAGTIVFILLIVQLYPDRAIFDSWNPLAQTILTVVLVLMVVFAREAACRCMWYLLRRRFDEPGSWQNELPLG